MPVTVAKKGNTWRVVEAHTGTVAQGPQGGAADGGGHASKGEAQAQARAINAHVEKK